MSCAWFEPARRPGRAPRKPHAAVPRADKRQAEYDGKLAEAFQCANILAALTPSEALNGNTLGLRQQPIASACDYYIFLW